MPKALIVVPENNTTMEAEISALCPALAPMPVARVKRPRRTLLLEDLPAYADATLDAVEPYADAQLDLVILRLHCRRLPRRPSRQRQDGI
jgi:maleate cis-trans isomerase